MKAPHLAVVASLSLVVACSSSTGVSQRDTLYGRQDALWLDAQAAIQDMGGRIITANRESGIVVGRLDVEGTAIQLDVSLSRAPGTTASAVEGEFVDVTVHASLAGVDDPDERWVEQLRGIVDDYMSLLARRTGPRTAQPRRPGQPQTAGQPPRHEVTKKDS